jgi:uncharacterized protein (TIGR02757 family)
LFPVNKSRQKEAAIKLHDIYSKEREDLIHLIGNDPVEFIHRYDKREDIEIAGFLAAQFAYGKIEIFKKFLESVFLFMEDGPRKFLEKGDFRPLKGCYYRFQKDKDIILLFQYLRKIYGDFGGIGNMLHAYYQGDIREALWKARGHLFHNNDALTFFFPKPSMTNPLKRWNLYLRWMVRKDTIDRGLWNFIDKSDLVIPLDTHLFKIGRCLGWTKRNSQSYGAALEITDVLKKLSPDDPLKYDFFLCHRIGIGAGCTGKKTIQCEKACLIYEI